MRKRKSPRVVWLPSDLNNRLGSAPLPAANPNDNSLIIKIFTAPPLGDPVTNEEIPIVKDFQANATAADEQASLSDLENSGYRLRRIVGKLFFFMGQTSVFEVGNITTCCVTAGFIIRRIAQDGSSMASLASGPAGTLLSTVSLVNNPDPWIWRRSWLLSNKNPAVTNTDNIAFAFNGSYGSALDGPHVDQKTARVVGPEERLFLSVSVSGVDGNAQTEPGVVALIGDLRILGSMRTSVGNRRNAQR